MGDWPLDLLRDEEKEELVRRVAEYLREVLDIDLSRQHAQAALGLPVDEV